MASEKAAARATITLACLRDARAFDLLRVVRNGTLAFLLPALLVLTACSSGGSVTPPGGNNGVQGSGAGVNGGSGSTSAGVQGSGSPGGSGTSVTGSGSGTMTPPSPAACDAYCTAIEANCTGVNAQYHDKASCLKACSYLPAGTPADTSGNTIGCRTSVAVMAATQVGMVKSFCWQAGPLGYGTCGEECDAFCTIATNYCSAAGGYTGAPVWPDYATCVATCAQFGRVIDFGVDGGYSAMGATGDTLECRAYHLVDNALQSPALQQTHCPHAAANSATCGPGPAASDGGTTPPPPIGDAGAPPRMVYDGGNIINSTNWDETKYPFAKRRMLLRDEGDPHVHLEDLGDPTKNWSVPGGGAWARSMQLVGNNQVLFGTDNGYNVVDLTDGHTIKTVTGYNSMAAYRMCNGDTMLTRPGVTLTFLDANDKVKSNIAYPGYGYVRLARPTRNGTFLVPSDTKLFEGDANGKVLWVTTGAGWQHVWEALLMADGNTLLCTAFGSSCDVVDKTTHMVTKRYGGKNMPNAAMYNPNFFSEYQILWNGNIITANWQGHGPGHGNVGIQVIEFDPQGNVVWSWKQDGARYSSIQGVQVLDGMDPKYLHCQEKSTDSTWQPVMP